MQKAKRNVGLFSKKWEIICKECNKNKKYFNLICQQNNRYDCITLLQINYTNGESLYKFTFI